MKNVIKVLVILISLLLGITTKGMAAELPSPSITSGTDGFRFVYTSNDKSSNVFLKKDGMLPGDSVSGKLTIFNNLKEPFKVYFKSNQIGENPKVDLGEVINISIKEGDKYIANSTMKNQNGTINNMYLGIVYPGEKKVLDVSATLDPKADDKYKNKKIENEWIFTAIGTKDNKEITSLDDGMDNSTKILEKSVNKIKAILPKTGYNYIILILIGIVLLVIGILVLKKEKKKKLLN